MATRKATKKEQFLVLSSSCGSLNQVEFNDEFTTMQAAEDYVTDDAADDYDNHNGQRTYFVVKVMKVGRSSGIAWEDA